jgi:hypothetical protein
LAEAFGGIPADGVSNRRLNEEDLVWEEGTPLDYLIYINTTIANVAQEILTTNSDDCHTTSGLSQLDSNLNSQADAIMGNCSAESSQV